MNKRLVALIVAVAVVALIVLLNFVFKKGSSGESGTCKDFIAAIQQGNADGSFAMFTDTARTQTTNEIWKKEVDGLKISYVNGSLKELKSEDTTPVGDKVQQTRYTYDLSSGGWHYKISCYVVDNKVNAFTSAVEQ
jgi:hypothetical protein